MTAIYTSTCCHPTANIIAVDVVGNTGWCKLSAVTRVLKIQALTKYTELNLMPGETTRLEFKIKNLGTKGSFTALASESKHFTGYVIPLTFDNLDHKEEARGEIVITGQKDTGSKKASLAINAEPLIKTTNVTHVQLFEITVIVGAKEERTPQFTVNKDAALKSLVPNRKVNIRAGANVTINFTVINEGAENNFTLKVRSILNFKTTALNLH